MSAIINDSMQMLFMAVQPESVRIKERNELVSAERRSLPERKQLFKYAVIMEVVEKWTETCELGDKAH